MKNDLFFEDNNLKEKEKSLLEIRKEIRETEKTQSLFSMLRLFILNMKKERLEEEIKSSRKNNKIIGP